MTSADVDQISERQLALAHEMLCQKDIECEITWLGAMMNEMLLIKVNKQWHELVESLAEELQVLDKQNRELQERDVPDLPPEKRRKF